MQQQPQQNIEMLQGGGGGQVMSYGPPGVGGQGYQFAANPQVLDQNILKQRANLFRKQYRDSMKMVPQNLMYDRRVVRGNTFGASVIPVAIEMDPALREKQQRQEIARKKRTDFIIKQREEQEFKKAELQEERRIAYQQQLQNPWQQLQQQDFGLVIEDMANIEPDYFINRPQTPEFIPNPKGKSVEVQVQDNAPELFDQVLELQPILQVLVGKALESGRIEVIEEWEKEEIVKHKKAYKQVRQARLIELQRQQAARQRRTKETEVLNIQQLTRQQLSVIADKKLTSRILAKQILHNSTGLIYRRLNELRVLRDDRENAIECRVLPSLYATVQAWLGSEQQYKQVLDKFMSTAMHSLGAAHRRSIVAERKKREEIMRERHREERQRAEEKQRRKEARRAARELARVETLRETIRAHIINKANIMDLDCANIHFFDVRTPQAATANTNPIYTVGGFVGELVLTISVLLDSILSNPEFHKFNIRKRHVVQILRKLLPQTPTNSLLLPSANKFKSDESNVQKQQEEAKQQALIMDGSFTSQFTGINNQQIDEMAFFFLKEQNRAGTGLQFLMSNEIIRALTINTQVIQALYQAVVDIKTRKPLSPESDPQPPNEEASQQEKKAHEDKVKQIATKNEAIQKKNNELQVLQSRINIVSTMGDQIYEGSNQAAVVLLNPVVDLNITENITANLQVQKINEEVEQPPADAQLSNVSDNKGGASKINQTQITRPQGLKTMIVDTRRGSLQVIPFHKGVQHLIRDKIIQAAKAVLPQLNEITPNAVLSSLEQRYMELEQKLIQNITGTFKFDGSKPVPCFEYDTIQ